MTMLRKAAGMFAVCCAMVITVACGPKRLAEMKIQDPAQCVNAVEEQGVRLCVKPIFDGAECESYYGINILKKGYLPVEVSMANHAQGSITVPLDSILLTYHGKDLKPTPSNDVYKDLKASVGGRTVGWTILCGGIGGVAAYNAAKHRNEALGSSLHTNNFEGQILEANKELKGVLYFKLPQEVEVYGRPKVKGVTLHLNAKGGSDSVISMSVPLQEPKGK
jgi:hypothetical protein